MKTFKLDENGDLDISQKSIQVTSGVDALTQNIKQKFKMFLGEWFLSEKDGLPYYEEIFKKNYNPITVETIFKRVLVNYEEIKEIVSFEILIDNINRSLAVNFEVKTDEGDTIDISEVL